MSAGLDNYLVTLAHTVQKLGVPLREDGWIQQDGRPVALAFHLGRFIYHAARIEDHAARIGDHA